MTFKRAVFFIVILVLVGVVGYSLVYKYKTPNSDTTTPATTTDQVTPDTSSGTATTMNYSCDAGKTIAATYANNSAALKLSDGRTLTLPQTISADGVQYGQGNVLFVTKGDQAFLQENSAITFNNCLTGITTAPTDSTKTFTDQGKTFTFTYPAAFTLAGGGIGYTENWKVSTDTTLGLILAKLTVPQSYQPKTNFGDATFTVGTSSDSKAVKSCLVDNSGNGVTKSTATVNGIKYTIFVSTDAGAGNRYETTSYRTVQHGQCYAIEYTIHYAVLENFDPSSGVTGFDQKKVHDALDGIVQSLQFLPQ